MPISKINKFNHLKKSKSLLLILDFKEMNFNLLKKSLKLHGIWNKKNFKDKLTNKIIVKNKF
jgi:hypothetical protein